MVLQLYEPWLWIFIYFFFFFLIFPVLLCPFGLDYTSISAATDALSMPLEVDWDLFATEESLADETSRREEKMKSAKWPLTFLYIYFPAKTSERADVKTAWLSRHSQQGARHLIFGRPNPFWVKDEGVLVSFKPEGRGQEVSEGANSPMDPGLPLVPWGQNL